MSRTPALQLHSSSPSPSQSPTLSASPSASPERLRASSPTLTFQDRLLCPYCAAFCAKSHLSICEKRLIPCSFCGAEVPFHVLESHELHCKLYLLSETMRRVRERTATANKVEAVPSPGPLAEVVEETEFVECGQLALHYFSPKLFVREGGLTPSSRPPLNSLAELPWTTTLRPVKQRDRFFMRLADELLDWHETLEPSNDVGRTLSSRLPQEAAQGLPVRLILLVGEGFPQDYGNGPTYLRVGKSMMVSMALEGNEGGPGPKGEDTTEASPVVSSYVAFVEASRHARVAGAQKDAAPTGAKPSSPTKSAASSSAPMTTAFPYSNFSVIKLITPPLLCRKVLAPEFLSKHPSLTAFYSATLYAATVLPQGFLMNCRFLVSVSLGELPYLKKIGPCFLGGCTSLKQLDWANLRSLRTVADSFLDRCSALETFQFDELRSLTKCGDSFFAECSAIRHAKLSALAALRSVGSYFFFGALHLVSLDLRGVVALKELGGSFLAGAKQLKSLYFHDPTEITSIGESFLMGCESLRSLNLNPLTQVEEIGPGFLCGCSSLEVVVVDKMVSVRSVDSRNYLRACVRLKAQPKFPNWAPLHESIPELP